MAEVSKVPHVMVPCPEEHVPEFTIAMMRLTMGMAGWDAGAVETFVGGLQGRPRELVLLLAGAAAEHERVPYREVARLLDMDPADVLDLVTEVNEGCRRASFPMPLMTDTHVAPSPSGEPQAVPVLTLVPIVARKILAAAAAAAPDGDDPATAGDPTT